MEKKRRKKKTRWSKILCDFCRSHNLKLMIEASIEDKRTQSYKVSILGSYGQPVYFSLDPVDEEHAESASKNMMRFSSSEKDVHFSENEESACRAALFFIASSSSLVYYSHSGYWKTIDVSKISSLEQLEIMHDLLTDVAAGC